MYYSPLFEAVAFVARVLDGTQIAQVFVPLTGCHRWESRDVRASVESWETSETSSESRTLTAADLAPSGLRPGVTPPVLLRTDREHRESIQPAIQFTESIATILRPNVSANYIGNRGVKLIRSRNVNLKQTGTNALRPDLWSDRSDRFCKTTEWNRRAVRSITAWP